MIAPSEFLKYLYVFNVPMHGEPGTGTVTSVGTDNGLTGGPITSSGTIGLAEIAEYSFLANNTAADGVPTAFAFSSYANYLIANYINAPISSVIRNTASSTAFITDVYLITYTGGVHQITIPSGFAVGYGFQVIGTPVCGGWQVNQSQADMQISWGNRTTTMGTAGYVASNDVTDSAIFWCYATDLFTLVQVQGSLGIH